MRPKGANGPNEELRRLADGQYGVVTRTQLLHAQFGAGWIRHAVRTGRLRGLYPGVYAVGHTALRREAWWKAGLLASGDRAALSHRSAAQLWGLAGGRIHPIEITGTGNRGRKHRNLHIHRMRLDPGDVVLRANLRVTTPARTIADLAARLDPRALRRLIERAQDRRLFDPAAVRLILDRRAGRPGSPLLRDLVLLHRKDEDGARSHLERLFLRLVRATGLPRPEVNVHIAGAERDFVWAEQRLVVEVDGGAYHSSRAARRRDHRRDRALAAGGWRVVRFTYEDVAFEPDAVASETAALLGSRDGLLAATAPSAARSR